MRGFPPVREKDKNRQFVNVCEGCYPDARASTMNAVRTGVYLPNFVNNLSSCVTALPP